MVGVTFRISLLILQILTPYLAHSVKNVPDFQCIFSVIAQYTDFIQLRVCSLYVH